MKRWGFWPCAVAGILLCASEPSLAYYHPTAGRWVSRDPAGHVEGMSLYQYAGSSAVSRLDPSGLMGPWDIAQLPVITIRVMVSHVYYQRVFPKNLYENLQAAGLRRRSIK